MEELESLLELKKHLEAKGQFLSTKKYQRLKHLSNIARGSALRNQVGSEQNLEKGQDEGKLH